MTTFAPNTKITVEQSHALIQADLARYTHGTATNFSIEELPGSAVVRFEAFGYRLRFTLPVPGALRSQTAMTAWRALWRTIVGKLQSIESGIETVEEAFLAHILDDDDRTMSERIRPQLPRPGGPSLTRSLPTSKEKEIVIKCRFCGQQNRIPVEKKSANANCSKCHKPLYDNLKRIK